MDRDKPLVPDKNSYDSLWDKIINVYINDFKKKYGSQMEVLSYAKDEIWKQYYDLNLFCKNNYMRKTDGRLDRHKVAACYLIAICMVKPLRFSGELFADTSDSYNIANHLLAISVGFSVLEAFIVESVQRDEAENKEKMLKKIENGLQYPDEQFVRHGSYIMNYATELYFSEKEGKLSILSIAHELFLLEVYNKMLV